MRYRPVNLHGEAKLPDYLNWEGKMTIPASWYDQTVQKLMDYVCQVYNERKPELTSVLQLNSTEYFLTKDYRHLGFEERIAVVVERGGACTVASTDRRTRPASRYPRHRRRRAKTLSRPVAPAASLLVAEAPQRAAARFRFGRHLSIGGAGSCVAWPEEG